MITVSALHVYPVKSCRGNSLDRVTLDALGFVDDRRFLVVDDRGRFLTQRDTPRLALIAAGLRNGRLHLSAPGSDSIDVPPMRDAQSTDVVIWHDSVRAVDLGDSVANWLAGFLARPARLAAVGRDFDRPMHKDAARPHDRVAFTDAHPLLVVGESSLADLNARLDFELPMNRFRPNLVVRGAGPYEEDRWRRIRIGSVVLRASGPCTRCVVTTTDQQTLARGKEPLRTLATYRRTPEGEVNFGQNYIHEMKSGEIAVGMPVEIIE